MNKIIVIVGPTGVGKTKASVELAKRLNAEIINGDAVSVYKELNIASAKPTLEERSGINHYLLDKVDVCDNYTIYDYQKDARVAIEEIKEKDLYVIGDNINDLEMLENFNGVIMKKHSKDLNKINKKEVDSLNVFIDDLLKNKFK